MKTLRILVILLFTLLVITTAQTPPIQIGELVRNIFSPDDEVMGGVRSVIDRYHSVDMKHQACSQRTVCEVLSNRRVTENSDTGLEEVIHDTGLLRAAVDGVTGVVMDLSAPLMDAVGLGPIARSEVSLIDFVVDKLDSLLIYAAEAIAGKRAARRIAEIGPLKTAVDVIGPRIIPPKVAYYGNLMDLAVDVFGVFDRDRGSYNFMRAGVLGFFQGENGVCDTLNPDICEDYWSVTSPLSSNKMGALIAGKVHGKAKLGRMVPLVEEGISFRDIFKPKVLLCKVDTYLHMLSGHIDSVENGEKIVEYEIIDARNSTDLEGILDDDSRTSDVEDDQLTTLAPDPAESGILLRNNSMLIKKVTPEEKFSRFCYAESVKMIRQQENERPSSTQATEVLEDNAIIVVRGNTTSDKEEDTVENNTTKKNKRNKKHKNKKNTESLNVDKITELTENGIILEKINDVAEGDEENVVDSILSPLNLDPEQHYQSIHSSREEDGESTIMIVFKTSENRDHVISEYRKYPARSSLTGRLRKPRLKDMKLLISLANNKL